MPASAPYWMESTTPPAGLKISGGGVVYLEGVAVLPDHDSWFDAHTNVGVSCGASFKFDGVEGGTQGETPDQHTIEGETGQNGYAWADTMLALRTPPAGWQVCKAKVRFTGTHLGESVTVWTPEFTLEAQAQQGGGGGLGG